MWLGASVSVLDELVREGARRMLAAASEAEVAAYVDARIGEVDEQGGGWWCATGIIRLGTLRLRRVRWRWS
jgi:hypothetical protein